MPEFTLSRELATALLKQAQIRPDERVCGLLLSRDGLAARVRPLRNVATDPARHCQLDAAELATATADASAQGLRLMATYLSHPHNPPEPAGEDLAARADAQLPLLLISLNIKGVLEMRAFTPHGDALQAMPVHIFAEE